MEHIVHSIPPTYDERSRVLVLGSLPSPKSRETAFNYGHPQNRFWRVLAQLAGEPVPATNARKRDFCLRHHIALWDVVAECDIEGASDASIRNAVPNDLALITRAAPIEAVFCTGTKAHELYCRLGCEQATGIPAVKLPSTSPANAACSMERLLEAYAALFEHTREAEPPVLDVAAVVELEQAIAASGTPLSELMLRAGTALAHRVLGMRRELAEGTYPRAVPGAAGRAVTLLCGNGNNGGDGWVAAEALAREGAAVRVVCAKMPADLRAQPAHDVALGCSKSLQAQGAVVAEGGLPAGAALASPAPLVLVQPDAQALEQVLAGSGIIVDAIFGTGYRFGEIAQPYLGWIEATNRHREHAAVLACDVPSGVSAQEGYGPERTTPRVQADETLTMIASKPGLAAKECGKVRVAPLAYIEPLL